MIAIFRTSKDTIGEVIRLGRYALRGLPNLRAGDTILVAQTIASTTDSKPPIRYRMDFVRAYPDRYGESEQIWGKQWAYMIECANCRPLKHPFDIRDVQVTGKVYSQGGTVVYVEPADELVLREQDYLEVR